MKKRIVAPLIVGSCLLLLSGGVVLANDPHSTNPSTNSGTGKGQPGTNNANGAVGCEVTTPLGTTPGNAASSPGAPFNEPGINSASGGNGGQHYAAGAEYDVACLQQQLHQVP